MRQSPILRLIAGDNEAEFVEHPTEVARKALMAAALIETPPLADHLRRFAETLPARQRAARVEGLGRAHREQQAAR